MSVTSPTRCDTPGRSSNKQGGDVESAGQAATEVTADRVLSTIHWRFIMSVHKALIRIVGMAKARKLPAEMWALRDLSQSDLMDLGLTPTDVRRLQGCVMLAGEIAAPYTPDDMRINSPDTAIRYVRKAFPDLHHSKQEEFWIVTLDTKNQPIRKFCSTIGTLRNSLVHPREVFRQVIADSANSFLAVHNHPSGDPTPSDQDIFVTERLEKAADVVGIPLLDHIIVGSPDVISIKQWQVFRPPSST